MPVSTENIRRWIEQSDIDYITHYIKCWIPFNAWYNANYITLNTDREKINAIKNNGNTIRNKINTLMENTGQESLEFKSFLSSLHQELLNTDVQGSNGRIWFQDIVREVNPTNQITENFSRIRYFLNVTHTRGIVSNVQINLNRTTGNNGSVFNYTHNEYNLTHLTNDVNFGNLTNPQQAQVRFYFGQLKPMLIKDVIEINPSIDGQPQNHYPCDAHNFKRDLSNPNCYSIYVCKSLIEILYQLRNVLFHGELIPNEQNQRIYKNAFFCLKYLLNSLR